MLRTSGTCYRLLKYSALLCAEALFLFVLNLAFDHFNAVGIAAILIGLINISFFCRRSQRLLNPFIIFNVIWLLLVGVTSFEFPLMKQMSHEEWNLTIVFYLSFAFGGMLSSLIFWKKGTEVAYRISANSQRITNFQFYCFIFLILVGIFVHVYQTYVYGGFVILSDNPSSERYSYSISGLGTLSTLGTIGIFGCFYDKKRRKNPLFLVLSFIYLFFLFAEGVRFQIFLTIILCLSIFDIKRIRLKFFAFGIILLLASIILFNYISSIRVGESGAYNYYIATGLYSGKASEITSTEIFRYFGFSQRLTDYYWLSYKPGVSRLGYTLYPITHTMGFSPDLPPRIWVMGYVATSVIVYFYCDFGYLWPLAAMLFSIVIYSIYYLSNSGRKSIFKSYCWALSVFALIMSFYAYLNAYVYAIVHFPLIIVVMQILNNSLEGRRYFYGSTFSKRSHN